MSNSKGVVNCNSKTLGVTRPNKKKEQEKSQEPCSTIGQKKKNRARRVKKKEKDDLMKKGKVDGGLMMTTRKLDQKKVVTLPPPAATTCISHPPVEFVSSTFQKNSMGPGKKPNLRNRIPPHSKIPLSAVEMPLYYSSDNINMLGVSFGAFDLSDDIPQLCDLSQEQNSLPPVVKYDDSIAQEEDSVLAQTEYSTISNQASVQTQRSFQVNQAPQPSIKILQRPNGPHSADYLTKQKSAVATSQEQNSLQPVVKYDESIAQEVDSVLAQTEYSTISNQASVQTQRSFQVNQAPQPSIKILRYPNGPHSADYLTKQKSAVATSQEQNSLQPVVKYDESIAQEVDSVLAQTEYSTISNQASVQTQRSFQVNQAPQPSIKILRYPNGPHSADYLTKQKSAVATSQEQNSLQPVVKYDESIAQEVDSVLAQTEYSTISNQASVQTQRSFQVNQAPQPSIKILRYPNGPHSADYLPKQDSAVVNPYQNINTGQPTSMYNSSVYFNNTQSLSSHTSLYGTTASSIGGNSSNSHNPQFYQSNYSNLNANYTLTEAQPQFRSYPYPNPYSYQASEISYPPIVSDANVPPMYSTSTNYNYMHQNIHQTGNTNLSKSTVLLTSNTNSTKESPYYQSQPSNNSWTSSASNPNRNIISDTTSSIGPEQTNESGVLLGMPPDVASLVDAQYILNQQCIPRHYSQSHSKMYSKEYLQMVQSGLPHHNMTNFYSLNPMYPSISSSLTGRETAGPGIPNVASYSPVTDSRYALTDNYASPDSSTLSQQTGTLAHQQILLNPPIAPSYYYDQIVVPANPFQYGTIYLMVPVGSATSHGTVATNTTSGYSNTAATPAGYNIVDETLGSSSVTGSSNDHGSSSKVGMSGQQTTQAQGITNPSDLSAMYPSQTISNKSLQSSKLFSVTNNDGVGGHHHTASSYPPVFNSSIPPGNPQPHHIAPLQHQQELSSETDNMSRNQSINPTANKAKVKQNYN